MWEKKRRVTDIPVSWVHAIGRYARFPNSFRCWNMSDSAGNTELPWQLLINWWERVPSWGSWGNQCNHKRGQDPDVTHWRHQCSWQSYCTYPRLQESFLEPTGALGFLGDCFQIKELTPFPHIRCFVVWSLRKNRRWEEIFRQFNDLFPCLTGKGLNVELHKSSKKFW